MRSFYISVTCAVLACGPVGFAESESSGISESEEQALFGGMPDDEGRLEVFGFCGSCHSIDLVLQQGLTRTVWEEVLVEMVRDQEMAPLREEDRRKVLDYLEKFYGPERRAMRAGKGRRRRKGRLPPHLGGRGRPRRQDTSSILAENLHRSQVDWRAVAG